MNKVVRPNRWDDRETRLQHDLAWLVSQVEKRYPDVVHSHRLDDLDFATAVYRAKKELARPMHADLDDRVRHPLLRWWRLRRLERTS